MCPKNGIPHRLQACDEAFTGLDDRPYLSIRTGSHQAYTLLLLNADIDDLEHPPFIGGLRKPWLSIAMWVYPRLRLRNPLGRRHHRSLPPGSQDPLHAQWHPLDPPPLPPASALGQIPIMSITSYRSLQLGPLLDTYRCLFCKYNYGHKC